MDVPTRGDYEAELAQAIARVLKRHADTLLDRLGDPPDLAKLTQADWDEVEKELRGTIGPKLEKIANDQALRASRTVKIGVDWARANMRAADWASQYTFDLVRNVTANTIEILQRSVASYYRDGWNQRVLREALSSSFGAIRAEAIAITEVTRAAVEGERILGAELQGMGLKVHEVWQTSADDLVCLICGPRNQRKEGDGWTRAMGPPAHPRCRCWTSTVVELEGVDMEASS